MIISPTRFLLTAWREREREGEIWAHSSRLFFYTYRHVCVLVPSRGTRAEISATQRVHRVSHVRARHRGGGALRRVGDGVNYEL